MWFHQREGKYDANSLLELHHVIVLYVVLPTHHFVVWGVCIGVPIVKQNTVHEKDRMNNWISVLPQAS